MTGEHIKNLQGPILRVFVFCSDQFFVPNNGFLVTGEVAHYVRMGEMCIRDRCKKDAYMVCIAAKPCEYYITNL